MMMMMMMMHSAYAVVRLGCECIYPVLNSGHFHFDFMIFSSAAAHRFGHLCQFLFLCVVVVVVCFLFLIL